MPHDEAAAFVPLAEAAAALGVHPETVKRRLRKRGLSLYVDPRDERRREVRAADLAALAARRPVAPRAGEGA